MTALLLARAAMRQEARIRNLRRSRRPDIALLLLLLRCQLACRAAAESWALVYFSNAAIMGYMVCMSLEHEYTRCPPVGPEISLSKT